ncbi:MAG: ABC transporter permease [Gemmatimonadales bacterium]|jgi:peptide/nickel transport system permease protein
MTALPLLPLAVILACVAATVRLLARRARSAAARRFFASPAAAPGLGLLLFFVALAVLAPLVAPYRPSAQLDIVGLQSRPPSWRFLLGTDLFSRDVFSRLVYGARVSLGIGVLATLVSVTLGAAVGAAAGYFRRATDAVLMRLVDVGLAVPKIFIVLVAVALGRPLGPVPLAVLLGLTGWFTTSRLVRAEVLSIREREFVEAARALGARPWRVIARHVLPGATAVLMVSAALSIANMMLLEAGLSFIGAGVQPPVPSWGNMIADARDLLTTAPWASLFPGLAITAVVLGLHAVSDGLREALDPQARGADPALAAGEPRSRERRLGGWVARR